MRYHSYFGVRVETIVRVLNDAKVKYLIVGGLAVNAHGFVRLTRDVGLVLGLEPANAARGLESLLQAGWRLAGHPRKAGGLCRRGDARTLAGQKT